MKKTIRAWKDARYRRTLTDAERAAVPAHPAGMIELSLAQLAMVAGGAEPEMSVTCSCSCVCGF